jgi:twinkle protein
VVPTNTRQAVVEFATEHNVHLTLVVHPRKEDESSKLNISSFYGSAKATQEADTVIILQNDGRRKYIEVKNNRFDGTLSYAPSVLQPDSFRISSITHPYSGGPVSILVATRRRPMPFRSSPNR